MQRYHPQFTDPPLVSVVVPAFNAATYVRSAIGSALAQTYQRLEVIVVDDGSIDGTADIVEEIMRRDPRVRLLRQSNAGVAAARNHAIREARGELIAPLDADDLWYPDKLERQVLRMIEGGSAVGLVYCACVRIDTSGDVIRPGQRWSVEGRVLDALLIMNFIENASTPLMRRSCVEAVGGYNEVRRMQGGQGCEDWELSLRIAERYELAAVSDYLVAYRVVPGSMSSNASSMGRGHQLLLEEVRRRHPRLPADLFRWSRSHFALYLAQVAADGGKGREARRWLGEAVRADRNAALSVWALKSLLRSAGIPVPFVSLSSGSPRKPPPGRPPPRSDVEIAPPLWKPWLPYDRLCMRRWQGLTGRRELAI